MKKLRSASSKGKAKVEYRESYEEDDGGTSESSDHFLPYDEGENSLNALGISRGKEVSNLNIASESACGNSQKLGRLSREKAQEDEGERYAEGDSGTAIDGPKKKGKKKKDKPLLIWQVIEKENNRWLEETMQMDMDMIDQNELSMETVEPSDDLIVPLLRYQKEWLAWALKQEESSARGGILADEMGMGKTLQAIALVLFKRSIARGVPEHDLTSSSSSYLREFPPVKGTVVICPTVAVKQWEREIYRFTSAGSTKVLVYHGVNRAKNLYQLFDYDFVITTYSIVELEFRKYLMPPKKKCQNCGKLFYDHKMKTHLQYACRGHAFQDAEHQSRESNSKKMPDIKVNKRKKNSDEESKDKSILHSVSWERIVLDEAHCIKERYRNTFKAVLALQSRYKWALTGTPLQNNVGELYSLVRFLQIFPYTYNFCSSCNCHTHKYRYDSTSEECPQCLHKSCRHFSWWSKYVAKPIRNPIRLGGSEEAMILLKHKILKSSLLRRTKKGRAADLTIPPRIVTLRRDSLDIVEEDFYNALYKKSKAQIDIYNAEGTISNNYAHILALLTHLRQAVDHPYLVEYSLGSMERKRKAVDTRSDIKCGICNDAEEETVVTSCGHIFCKPCLIDFSSKVGQNSCPSCSKPFTDDYASNKDGKEQRSKTTIAGFRPSSILNRIQLNNFQTSTKINALREEIRFMVERDGSAKGIVFSQFPSFLDLMHYALNKSGLRCLQLDGSMSIGEKDAALVKFSEDPSCRIMLMSLKTAAVALNLTAASHVFLMDPWWNPAVEQQAQDRIHRIGQSKPTRVVRFIMENTIDESILKLQEKKQALFECMVDGHSAAVSNLTADDLMSMFGVY